MNDYQRLRNAVKKCYTKQSCMCVGNNVMTCASQVVRKWVDGDKDKLLELKAQARNSDLNVQRNSITSTANMAIAMFTIYFTVVVGMDAKPEDKVAILLLLLLMLLIIYLIVSIVNYSLRKIGIWNEYMNIAIEEVEKELGESSVG